MSESDAPRARKAIIGDIAANLASQDNQMTSHPMFLVEQKRRHTGYDPVYAPNPECIVWIDGDGIVTDADEIKRLDEEFNRTAAEPGDYIRSAYVDRWEFVTACFTEQGCKDYIAANGHNLKEPRIYVASGYGNAEWQAVRQYLLSSASAVEELAAVKSELNRVK